MAEDLEVGVLLEPKNNLEEDVGPVSVGQEGDGGGLSASQQQEQEGIISGGVSEALAAAGVLGALLSQLKSVTGLISAILGFFSRALLPTVEVIADLIRPLIEAVNQFIASPGETVSGAAQATQATLGEQFRDPFNVEGDDRSAIRRFRQEQGTTAAEIGDAALDTITSFIGFGPQSADQTGEAQKQSFLQTLEDGKRDKTGASK